LFQFNSDLEITESYDFATVDELYGYISRMVAKNMFHIVLTNQDSDVTADFASTEIFDVYSDEEFTSIGSCNRSFLLKKEDF
jgi:hypothetical protein